jgi:hypothetical protein
MEATKPEGVKMATYVVHSAHGYLSRVAGTLLSLSLSLSLSERVNFPLSKHTYTQVLYIGRVTL